jgi:hypothetical protein
MPEVNDLIGGQCFCDLLITETLTTDQEKVLVPIVPDNVLYLAVRMKYISQVIPGE